MRGAALAGALATFLAAVPAGAAVTETTIHLDLFSDVRLYRDKELPQRVVLFVSGEDGWDASATGFARTLVAQDALVIGVDLRTYLSAVEAEPRGCWFPAADFERLSQCVQKQAGMPSYQRPFLVGYAAGGALSYAILAESPTRTYLGAISIEFQSELPTKKPPCRGAGLDTEKLAAGGIRLLPATRIGVPWVVLTGEEDKAHGAAAAREFTRTIPGARVVALAHVAAGLPPATGWLEPLSAELARVVQESPRQPLPSDPRMADLPLAEVRASRPTGTLAVHLTGDGGWCGMDRQLAEELAARGVDVVAWDTLRYFWVPRTPESTAKDLERILRYYSAAWKSERIIVEGYSYGADILPFLLHRLPEDLRTRITAAALIGLSEGAAFELNVSVIARDAKPKNEQPTLPELMKCKGIPLLCICGETEKHSLCERLPPGLAQTIRHSGGHTLGHEQSGIAEAILTHLPGPTGGG